MILISLFLPLQDNCPAHSSAIVRECFQQNNINVLPWPAKSPDINVIEYIWARMTTNLYSHGYRPRNAEVLWQNVLEQWDDLPLEYVRNLINDVPNRLQAVIDNDGGSTRY